MFVDSVQCDRSYIFFFKYFKPEVENVPPNSKQKCIETIHWVKSAFIKQSPDSRNDIVNRVVVFSYKMHLESKDVRLIIIINFLSSPNVFMCVV